MTIRVFFPGRTVAVVGLFLCGICCSHRCGVVAWAAAPGTTTSNPHNNNNHNSDSNNNNSRHEQKIINLQRFHLERSPAATLDYLSRACDRLGVTDWDVYGDHDQTTEESFLRRFEAEVAQELGFADGVIVPSGGMAQSIALLVHRANVQQQQPQQQQQQQQQQTPTGGGSSNPDKKTSPSDYFACHHTSHLLLYEEEAYRELLHLEPLIIDTRRPPASASTANSSQKNHRLSPFSIPPMTYATTKAFLDEQRERDGTIPSTLILELPHRELGGKVPPFQDILQMREYCDQHGIRFHLDGARLFEATTGYTGNDHEDPDVSLKELVAPFDSVYLSFYKGLGGMTGAMLLGSHEFCQQARIWLRRLGGNVYTILPYAVSGWAGYRRQWCQEPDDENEEEEDSVILSFLEKKRKLVGLVEAISQDVSVSQVLTFDPAIPQTNMVHGYLWASVDVITAVLDDVERKHGIRVLFRVRPVSEEQAPVAYQLGYRAYFEWTMGEANGQIQNEVFLRGWKEVARGLLENYPPSRIDQSR